MNQVRVYTASKIEQAERWIRLRAEWPEVHFTARWPFMVAMGGETKDGVARGFSPSQFWQDDLADVARAQVVLVFGESHEHLRGALVEAGMGIALRKQIIVVGEHPDYGTWQFHPSVHRVADLSRVRNKLKEQSLWI